MSTENVKVVGVVPHPGQPGLSAKERETCRERLEALWEGRGGAVDLTRAIGNRLGDSCAWLVVSQTKSGEMILAKWLRGNELQASGDNGTPVDTGVEGAD